MTLLTTKIPTTVITGFLGSGKTTMIRHLLENANGKRIALIINEFGDFGVDGNLLKSCGIENCKEEDVIELNNGCICCTVADDFIPAMTKILARSERPDHIIIETSGLALPQPLVAAFNWPEIKTSVTVDGVITVVDSAAVAEGRFADDHDKIAAQRATDESLDHESPLEELFEDQIKAADLIVLNKTDLIDEQQLAEVKETIAAHGERVANMVAANFGKLGADILLGLNIGTESDIENRKSHHEMHHEEGEAHSHDEFESFVVELGEITNPSLFVDRLKNIISDNDILRLKGFMAVKGKAMRLVVQAVGSRIQHYYDRPLNEGEKGLSRLVVIGLHDMDATKITNSIQQLADKT
ncbi:cobalamin biosynthesis protein CobW [Bartonella sp. HY329]|uniref:cobalamin biosynthesis protein CobW n=1 Tax=unclassified Bartonella TaxID=2645622 RepID=UPI0021C8D9EA|nr:MULTISPECIES: cobalamin biosynthesis protein CobW [unclassified Bartonella]UXM94020.1 cobalamin biosynthesis protein CobW [Bartonella sp. HY329]UXN08342.1 cobalamin biosynthesis protein CobW [Bartonella sp. HY328]